MTIHTDKLILPLDGLDCGAHSPCDLEVTVHTFPHYDCCAAEPSTYEVRIDGVLYGTCAGVDEFGKLVEYRAQECLDEPGWHEGGTR